MQEISEEKNLEILMQCPRFIFCSVNKCPLDYFCDCRNKLKGEGKCTIAKSIRMRIGKKSGLTSEGLTVGERAAMTRFGKLTQKEKEKLTKQGFEALKKFKTRCSQR